MVSVAEDFRQKLADLDARLEVIRAEALVLEAQKPATVVRNPNRRGTASASNPKLARRCQILQEISHAADILSSPTTGRGTPMDYCQNLKVIREPSTMAVLIADPFIERSASLASNLAAIGYEVVKCFTLAASMSACLEARPSHVLTELPFPDGCGMDLVRLITAHLPSTRTVVHTWFADIPTAVAAAKAGAYDLVPKPTDEEFLLNILLSDTDRVPAECKIRSAGWVRQEHIEQVMRITSSNISAAARKLQLDRRSLQRMLKRYEDQARSQTGVDG